uniref:MoCF_biosynth domain-containing protein n=1 Tax=Trichuris muris TaxID=70415 RepID=A0A5S6QAY0_TRIMR
MAEMNVAILVVRDRCAEETRGDKSGRTLLEELFNGFLSIVVPDDKEDIENALFDLSSGDSSVQVVITVGGTGFAPRDVTPEAIRNIVEKKANGLAIALISASLPAGAYSLLVKECWDVLCPLLPHIVALMCNRTSEVQQFHRDLEKPPDSKSASRCSEVLPNAGKEGTDMKSTLTLKDALGTIYEHIDAKENEAMSVPVDQAHGFVLLDVCFENSFASSESSNEGFHSSPPLGLLSPEENHRVNGTAEVLYCHFLNGIWFKRSKKGKEKRSISKLLTTFC